MKRPVIAACLSTACISFCLVAAQVRLSTAMETSRANTDSAEAAPSKPEKNADPIEARDSLRFFELHPDVKIELVASEPQVVDPVAVAFDEAGRLWVVEMNDYPHGPTEGEPPSSKIKILRDKDGDGYYESSTVFADRLLFANGVLPYKGGVIATLSGEIAYLKDTDGDDRMDLKETWFKGFAEQNPQLRANHPTLGLDGWIYVSNGLRGGNVVAVKPEWAKDAKPLDLSRVDFRFHPETGKYEGITGTGQFGLTFDDEGNRFACSNRNPCMHIVIEQRDLAQNPYALLPSLRADVSPPGQESRVYSITDAWTTSTQHAGQFTAACGVTIYRGDALGDQFYGNSFTCEPTGSLLHRDVLTPKGGSFTSHYGRKEVEFLASRDSWFRPVNMAHGPDGALYLCDMYRAVIEHPQFMPEELKVRRDLTYGNDRGRIYRLSSRKGTQEFSEESIGVLSELSSKELVTLLSHPNAWQRDTAFRLLGERGDKSIEPLLRKAMQSEDDARPAIAALWLLSRWNLLTDDDCRQILESKNPKLVKQLFQAEEERLIGNSDFHNLIEQLAGIDDGHLQLRLSLSVGKMKSSSLKTRILSKLSARTNGDRWLTAGIRIAAHDAPVELLGSLLKSTTAENLDSRESVLEELSDLIGVRGLRAKTPEVNQALEILSEVHPLPEESEAPEFNFSVWQTVLEGLGNGLRTVDRQTGDEKLSADTRSQLRRLFRYSSELAANPEADTSDRARSLQLLRFDTSKASLPVLERIALNESNTSLRQEAIGIWAARSPVKASKALLENYSRETPSIRSTILGTTVQNATMVPALLDACEAGMVPVGELQDFHRRVLARHKQPELQKRIKAVLASSGAEDRKPVLKRYQAALSLEADPKRGREVFKQNCITCHRIGKLGVNVAPDIADSRTAKPETLLLNIIDPNRAIDNNYFSYTIVLDSGKVLTGIIANETANSVTLRQPENKTVTLLKDEIEEMKSDGVSLMPVGLEKKITIQDMADLISFIKNWRYLDGNVPIDVGKTTSR
jgi:putative membrane-bound dehydrogenase-like protein